jgi:transposase-like protein
MADPILNQPHFQDADKAREYLEALRWANGIVCPHCGVIGNHYKLDGVAHRPGLYKCTDCRKQFSVTVGTVFESSKVALNLWLQVTYLMSASKKGISAKQVERMLGVTYKTAWFMCHRVREAMRDEMVGQLGGAGAVVEADETYYGREDGVSKKKSRAKAGAALVEANKVVSLVERGGKVRSFHVTDVTGDSLKSILEGQIDKDSALMTDSSPRYNIVKRDPKFASYEQVNHSADEYVRGNAHTNTVEGYFSILKRGIVGTFHSVSSQHLHRYTNEFDFRYNNRIALGVNDVQRTDNLLLGIAGKRLTYRGTH